MAFQISFTGYLLLEAINKTIEINFSSFYFASKFLLAIDSTQEFFLAGPICSLLGSFFNSRLIISKNQDDLRLERNFVHLQTLVCAKSRETFADVPSPD